MLIEKVKEVKITENITVGNGKIFLIAGPCVIESEDLVMTVAEKMKEITDKLNIQYIFKASFDKANRSSISSFRGPGLEKGLEILSRVKEKFGVALATDIHEPWHCKEAAKVIDILQIPAFLSRQTDLLIAAGETGKAVNIKKGQFLAPWDMKNVVKKFEEIGNPNIMLCERGASFGYNNLVVDMRGLLEMRKFGYPVVLMQHIQYKYLEDREKLQEETGHMFILLQERQYQLEWMEFLLKFIQILIKDFLMDQICSNLMILREYLKN